ncbi:MAG TPA: Fis family transcriptional regulator [Thauera sp.]|nr:Fis family transcriptional regulator [Thauera sp.]HAY10504.1 Fis family transcriptional regulator [Thauera sp.]HNR62270.1 Fis family transcriptional regulator [Thauera sp.]HNS93750.1 Fis family transcriptional regulator [Thauera sp.]HRJ25070.1 Fis family transcriptional regulator [Thauera sp.]
MKQQHDSRPSPDALTPSAHPPSALQPERHARLVTLSAPAMEDLHRQLDSPSVTVILTDSAGTVLRAIGTRPRAADTIAPQGIGIAAPILPPAGGLLGFIDVDISQLGWLTHANALVQTAARIIEHRLIESEPEGFLLLRFHRYPAVLGTPLEALTLFDAEGCVLAANRVALELLASCTEDGATDAPACFTTHWRGIVGYAALGLRQPFTLRDRRGMQYSARASLRRGAHP